ncbi:uncharacterized protein STEHIDRAFT_154942 [Stereum hirsutum FP-91666 SS1]|uniref:uncharacterized protein n=1 Tax=Stereum hirsutum (strain FP-91666) TaxID=721885 RepID=UPI000440F0B1|nr:uncharacterized protein STEHIDRAFT_154942 [Stereum hirsutum FP-91666 SS1]EIM89264.1 hypothetical protein STEHIDRAFT_154942 [Stereum hirsutum FP-91666 SS1]
MSRQRSDLVFGFLANEVELMERAKAHGFVADLSLDAIERYKARKYTDAEIAQCQWFRRAGAMLTYVKREISPRVAIPDLELRGVWVGDDLCIHCFSLPLRYASKRYRTPEIVAQIKLLAKLIETEFPPSLYRAVSAEVPNDLKGQKLPPALANYRIEDLPF